MKYCVLTISICSTITLLEYVVVQCMALVRQTDSFSADALLWNNNKQQLTCCFVLNNGNNQTHAININFAFWLWLRYFFRLQKNPAWLTALDWKAQQLRFGCYVPQIQELRISPQLEKNFSLNNTTFWPRVTTRWSLDWVFRLFFLLLLFCTYA